jgi:Icc-related predicted phosphoesterase
VSLYNIEFELQNSKHKNVIITHHAPSFRSIPPQFNDSNVNSGYASNLEYMFKDYNIDLWIHGHIHEAQDYFIDNTRILCNPYGYRGYENSGYNPNLIAEI